MEANLDDKFLVKNTRDLTSSITSISPNLGDNLGSNCTSPLIIALRRRSSLNEDTFDNSKRTNLIKSIQKSSRSILKIKLELVNDCKKEETKEEIQYFRNEKFIKEDKLYTFHHYYEECEIIGEVNINFHI